MPITAKILQFGDKKGLMGQICSPQFCQQGTLTSLQNIQNAKKQSSFFSSRKYRLLKLHFLCSPISQLNLESVEGPLKMPQINGVKPQ